MGEIKLSEFCDINEKKWNEEERKRADKLIEYLKSKVDVDLYGTAKTTDNLEVFNRLRIWLLQYKEQLLQGLETVDISYEEFQKSSIVSLILSITRKRSNADFLIEVFKQKNIIDDLVEYEKDKYKIVAKNLGEIYFETADSFLESDSETLEFINRLGDKVVDGCHEISFYLIKKHSNFRAITSICTKGLGNKYYHSFALDNDRVIDLTGNLIMPKDSYYLLNNVNELNNVSYAEYLEEKEKSIGLDESNTIFPLLRNALYKQYLTGEQ